MFSMLPLNMGLIEPISCSSSSFASSPPPFSAPARFVDADLPLCLVLDEEGDDDEEAASGAFTSMPVRMPDRKKISRPAKTIKRQVEATFMPTNTSADVFTSPPYDC